MTDRITYDTRDDALIDEIVLTEVDVHLEVLDHELAHLRITSPGRSLAVDAAARGGALEVRLIDQDGEWPEAQP